MKFIPYLILLCICSISCQTQKSNNAILSGTIHVKGVDSLVLSNTATKYKRTIAVTNSTFSDTIFIDKIRSFYLQAGKKYYALYLQKGDNLNITIDSLTLEGISFSGTGAAVNNYIKAKNLFTSKKDWPMLGDLRVIDTISAQEHTTIVNEVYNEKMAFLENAELEDKNFIAFEKEDLIWDKIFRKVLFDSGKEMLASRDTTKTYSPPPPGFFPEAHTNFKADNEDLYINSYGYWQIANRLTMQPPFASISKKADRVEDNIIYLDSVYNTIDIVSLKDKFSYELGKYFVGNKDQKIAKAYFDYFTSKFSEGYYKKDFVSQYNKAQEMKRRKESLIGTTSPKFVDYENFAGGTTSLDDLKGKYVYIDVWATWCAPCKKEIPFLQKVEKKYHDKNIAFVSISVDNKSAHDTWKKMVAGKQLTGIQLFADNAFQSQFVQDYGIKGIPRFILIDPQGNVVSSDAPRPSSPELVELFDSLDM